jgi:NAD+ kinase
LFLILWNAALKVSRVLVIQKKSTYQLQAQEHKEARFIKLLEEGAEVVTRVKLAHEEHMETVESLERELTARGIQYKAVWREQIQGVVTDYDLVISVGGDGTFLDASHAVQDLPILGVNSSSSSSFGHFCMARKDTFAQILDDIQSDAVSTIDMLRLTLRLNGEVIHEPVLNEVLVAHDNPGATTRYLLQIDGRKEEHRCSGIYIATPAGSTGSVRSAGARVLPIDDMQYEYWVREACIRPGESLAFTKGLLPAGASIVLTSQMRTGKLFIDGPHISYPFALGDTLEVTAGTNNLRAYVNPNVNDIFNSYIH